MKFMNKMSSLICLSLICVLLFLQIFFLISQTWVYKIVTVGMHPPIHTAVVFLTKQFLHYFYDTYVYFFSVLQWQQESKPCPASPSVPLHAPVSMVHWPEHGGHDIRHRILQNLLCEGYHTREYMFIRPKNTAMIWTSIARQQQVEI